MINLNNKTIEELIAKVNSLLLCKPNIIIAIDGPCAGGKTTLSAYLGNTLNADVLHMDDFFLPMHMRTDERYNTPGGNVHYERFLSEVLTPLFENKEYIYKPFDCKTMGYKESLIMTPKHVTIVEGSYSCHPELSKYYDLKVFVNVDYDTQKDRILTRNGAKKAREFASKWIPLENKYFTAFDIKNNADIIIELKENDYE